MIDIIQPTPLDHLFICSSGSYNSDKTAKLNLKLII